MIRIHFPEDCEDFAEKTCVQLLGFALASETIRTDRGVYSFLPFREIENIMIQDYFDVVETMEYMATQDIDCWLIRLDVRKLHLELDNGYHPCKSQYREKVKKFFHLLTRFYESADDTQVTICFLLDNFNTKTEQHSIRKNLDWIVQTGFLDWIDRGHLAWAFLPVGITDIDSAYATNLDFAKIMASVAILGWQNAIEDAKRELEKCGHYCTNYYCVGRKLEILLGKIAKIGLERKRKSDNEIRYLLRENMYQQSARVGAYGRMRDIIAVIDKWLANERANLPELLIWREYYGFGIY